MTFTPTQVWLCRDQRYRGTVLQLPFSGNLHVRLTCTGPHRPGDYLSSISRLPTQTWGYSTIPESPSARPACQAWHCGNGADQLDLVQLLWSPNEGLS
jgi:hypothetical protein